MALDNDDRTLYVANLHKNVTEELLYELFVQAGPIERVSIPKLSNQNFQYGFVTYIHECSINYAIELYKGTCLFKKKLLIKRKGDRRSEQMNTFSRSSNEGVNNQEKNLMNLAELEQSYFSKYIHQQNDLSSLSKPNAQLQSLMQGAYKGQWSERFRPYDRDSRRQNSGRSMNFNSRDRHRNRNSNSHYNKSHRERKGRYWE